MRVTEKDLCIGNNLIVADFPSKNGTKKAVWVKPLNCYVSMTYLVNTYLKTLDKPKHTATAKDGE